MVILRLEGGPSQLGTHVSPNHAFPANTLSCAVDGVSNCVLIWTASNLILIKSSFLGLGLPSCWQGRWLQAASTPRAWQSPFACKVTKSSLLYEFASSATKPDFPAHCPAKSVPPLMTMLPRKAWGNVLLFIFCWLHLCSSRKCQGAAVVRKALTSSYPPVGYCRNKFAWLSPCWERLLLPARGALVFMGLILNSFDGPAWDDLEGSRQTDL